MTEITMPFNGTELTGCVVRLREFRSSDLNDSLAVVSDDRVTQSLSFDSLTQAQQEIRLNAAIERARQTPRTEYYLAVTTRTDDRLIGFARLGLGAGQAAKLGYAIAYEHWGNGYATDASRTLIGHAFSALNLHRITAAMAPHNAASIAIVKRLGFTYEGTLRDHVFTNCEWRNSDLYSILAQDWQPAQAVEHATHHM